LAAPVISNVILKKLIQPKRNILSMKSIGIIFTIFLILQTSLIAYASEWENYIKIKDKYYYLDKQDFNIVSCQVRVPLMENIIKEMKSELAPLQEQIEITEDLTKFSMSYSPVSGLNFTYPEFDIKIKSQKGMSDPERVKNGIKMAKDGFKQQVDGTVETVTGLFGGYFYPRKDQYNDIKVSNGAGNKTVSYVQEGENVGETYSGNTIEGTRKSIGSEINFKQTYKKTPDSKLIMKHGAATVTQQLGKMQIETFIEYQEVGQLFFPKEIKTIFEQEIQSISQKGQIDIIFCNCTIE
jgi:hypothetical protein